MKKFLLCTILFPAMGIGYIFGLLEVGFKAGKLYAFNDSEEL